MQTSLPKPSDYSRARTVCDRCGSGLYDEAPIHGGRSLRRDCARCKRMLGFPLWHGVTEARSEAAQRVCEALQGGVAIAADYFEASR